MKSPLKMTAARTRGLRAVRAAADLALSNGDTSAPADLRRGIEWIDAYLSVHGVEEPKS